MMGLCVQLRCPNLCYYPYCTYTRCVYKPFMFSMISSTRLRFSMVVFVVRVCVCVCAGCYRWLKDVIHTRSGISILSEFVCVCVGVSGGFAHMWYAYVIKVII